MKDEKLKSRKSGPSAAGRKLNFRSRLRGRFRHIIDRILTADVFWSCLFIVVVVSLLGSQRCSQGFEHFEVGDRAPYDIRATYDFIFEDTGQTDQRREDVRKKISPIYTHDTELGIRLANKLGTTFERGRRLLEDSSLEGLDDATDRSAAEFPDLDEHVRESLLRNQFSASIERELTTSLTSVMRKLIVGNKILLNQEELIVLNQIPRQHLREISEFSAFIDVFEARDRLWKLVEERLQGKVSTTADLALLSELAVSFIDANVHFDSAKTDERTATAEQAVAPVMLPLARGDLLVHQGDLLTESMVDKLRAATPDTDSLSRPVYFLGLLVIVSMFAFFLYRYSGFHQRRFRKVEHLHALLVMMMLSMLTLAKALLWLAGQVVDNLSSPYSQLHLYNYLVPLGAGSILVALLANGRIATVYSAFLALLFGAMNGWDASLMVWSMLVQCAGVYAISTDRERAALLRAGLVVGSASGATVLAMETIKGNVDILSRPFYGAGLAFIGGSIGVGLLLSFCLPVLERLFSVLTDLRLLELSNLNHPLLTQMAVKAPGSYNHSLIVGTLSDEGARAIGASALFCRVAAFYHDIGKMNKAEYYVENQRGVNPHDKLSPSMSALVIAAHVKDGIKMAREAGLPEQIVDIIPQHHGTKLMTYFYEKAKKEADPSLGPVKEEDFRYPGPKPKTREAAIFMIADGVEAAARTVDEPNPNRLRDVIRKVTESIVLDGQLEDCELTFSDLQRVQDAFLRLLVGMYHHRVDYPGFDFNARKTAEIASDAGRQRPSIRS
jgi:putative nucleotidyltransferase with HDIG domain